MHGAGAGDRAKDRQPFLQYQRPDKPIKRELKCGGNGKGTRELLFYEETEPDNGTEVNGDDNGTATEESIRGSCAPSP